MGRDLRLRLGLKCRLWHTLGTFHAQKCAELRAFWRCCRKEKSLQNKDLLFGARRSAQRTVLIPVLAGFPCF